MIGGITGNMIYCVPKYNSYFEIDGDDFDLIARYTWCFNKQGYAISRICGKAMGVHRLIMGDPNGMDIDHIDGNPKNNKKSNLRICTRQQNNQNRQPLSNCTSCYKGVYWNKRNKKWRAHIVKDSKSVYIGVYSSEIDAAKAYNVKATELFGEFARLNPV